MEYKMSNKDNNAEMQNRNDSTAPERDRVLTGKPAMPERLTGKPALRKNRDSYPLHTYNKYDESLKVADDSDLEGCDYNFITVDGLIDDEPEIDEEEFESAGKTENIDYGNQRPNPKVPNPLAGTRTTGIPARETDYPAPKPIVLTGNPAPGPYERNIAELPDKKYRIVQWILSGVFAMLALINGICLTSILIVLSSFIMMPIPYLRRKLRQHNIKTWLVVTLSVILMAAGVITSFLSDTLHG